MLKLRFFRNYYNWGRRLELELPELNLSKLKLLKLFLKLAGMIKIGKYFKIEIEMIRIEKY